MSAFNFSGITRFLMFGFAVLGMVLVGYGLGRMNPAQTENQSVQLPIELKADTASRGEKLSFATGIIDTNLEGLFVLDHLTGTLQCWVVNPRSGGVAAIYQANVGTTLSSEKDGKADYVMATGTIDFTGLQSIGNNLRPANCVVYVGEGNSGKVVGYSLFFNRSAMLAGRAQGGQLQEVCVGQVRGAGLLRDQ
jgi:hypothetical protein